MIPRVGEPVKSGMSYKQRPGAYALLLRGDTLLLTLQSEPEPEMQLPGGGIDPGEPPLRALHREILEETGWSIAGPVRIGAYRRFTYMPEYDLWAEKICHIYLARPAMQRHPPTEPHHSAVWTDLDTAADILGNAGDRGFAAALADVRRFRADR